jgi:hypothetical protein
MFPYLCPFGMFFDSFVDCVLLVGFEICGGEASGVLEKNQT